MSKSSNSHKATSARRKVKTSTARSRKAVARPRVIKNETQVELAGVASGDKSVKKSVATSRDTRAKLVEPVSHDEQKDLEERAELIRQARAELAKETEKIKDAAKTEKLASEPVAIKFNKKQEVVIARPAKTTRGRVEQPREAKIRHFDEVVMPMSPVAMTERNSRLEMRQPMMAPVVSEGRTRVETEQPVMMPVRRKRLMAESIATEGSEKTPVRKLTAKEMKEREISKAMNSAEKRAQKKPAKKERIRFGFGRILLALGCATAAVFAIVYFVNLSAPDVSLKVAAMQSGIEAKYPNYVPRDFNLSDITSESGKITMNFKNPTSGDAYTLVEEKSSWDSAALLTNFVKIEYGEDYTAVKEQGLTLYISGSNACWVNGGIVFKLKTTSGSLTKKQIRAIAVSL
ncbi:hypothetical protein IKE83_00530 [Candidatus Saccharibacteria bacterium]|nr:hypothetical protein [Candidatus Saccharibacteria bacterium]